MGEPHPDLTFDHAAAQAVIDQANAVIKLTHTQTDARVTSATTMLKHWRGSYADDFFKNELPRMRSGAGSLVTELQNLVKQMETAMAHASVFAGDNSKWHQQQEFPGPLRPGY